MPTKHRTIRLSDEYWQMLATKFQEEVPPERRPMRANPESDWQITEGLRMIVDDEAIFRVRKSKKK